MPRDTEAALTHLNADVERPRYYLTNNIMLEVALFLALTAFKAVQNLSSSQIGTPREGQHDKDILGCFALSVLYFSTACCTSIGHLGITRLGHKWSLTIALGGYTSFTLGNVIAAAAYHSGSSQVLWIGWLAELGGALMCGVAAAVLWPAHDAYSLVNAQGYTAAKNMGAVSAGVMARTGTKAESAASRQAAAASAVHETAASSATLFSWIFFFTFQMTGVFGNLISSLLMTYSQGIENNMYLLYLVYYFIALGGVLLGALLRTPKRVVAAADPLAEAGGAATVEETPLPSLEGRGAEGIAECLTAGAPVFARALVSPFTLFNPRRRMRAVRLLCCVPMMLYAGCETAYFVSHFTSTFIQPVLGARSIGFIMMAFALGSALSSISVGVLQVRPSFLWCAFLLLLLIYSFACSLRSRSAPCRACSATRCFSGSGSSATSRCFPFSSSPATNWSTRRRRSAPCGSSSFSARFSGARVTPRSTRSLPSGSGARTGWWTSRRRSLSSARSCRGVCSSILCATSYSFVYPLFFSCFLFTHRFVSLHDYTMSCCRPSPRTSACGSASAPPSPFSSIRSSPGLRQ